MASVLIGQFLAWDDEGRVYPVQEYRESSATSTDGGEVTTRYRTAIGDRVTHLGGNEFELTQSSVKVKLTRRD